MEVYSFSRLDGWEQCKLKHKYKYIDKLEGVGNSWSELGTFVHEAIEKYPKGGNELLEYVSNNYPVHLKFPRLGREPLEDKYGTQIMDFFYYFHNEGIKDELIAIEDEFSIEIEGRKIIGFIDVVTKGIKVIDWKISNPFTSNLPKKLKQLYIYAEGIKQKYGEYPKEMFFYFVKTQTFHKEVFDLKKLEDTLSWAVGIMEEIEREEHYHPSPEKFFCSHLCEFRNICKFGKK